MLKGADGRPHDQPVGVFFSGDPQTDTLLPASLLNGFALEGREGRVAADVFFPFLDMTIKMLADSSHGSGLTVGQRVIGVVSSSLSGAGLDQAVAEHKQEVATFVRNKVDYPYNLLRDFEHRSGSDEPKSAEAAQTASTKQLLKHENGKVAAPRILHHNSGRGNILAYQLPSMAALEHLVSEWSQGSLVSMFAAHTHINAFADGVECGSIMRI